MHQEPQLESQSMTWQMRVLQLSDEVFQTGQRADLNAKVRVQTYRNYTLYADGELAQIQAAQIILAPIGLCIQAGGP